MKKFKTLLIFLFVFSFLTCVAIAQESIVSSGGEVVEATILPVETIPTDDFSFLDNLLKFIVDFAAKHPMFSMILMVIGFLRLINKPLFGLLRMVVGATSTKKDDEILSAVEESKFYKMLTYALDWFGSIKLKK